MPLDDVAVDEQRMAALERLGHSVLALERRKRGSLLDGDRNPAALEHLGVGVAALALGVLIENGGRGAFRRGHGRRGHCKKNAEERTAVNHSVPSGLFALLGRSDRLNGVGTFAPT